MTRSDLVLTPNGVRFMGRYFPCSIGKGGISEKKREGDGATPIGVHRIVGMLYRADRITPPVPWAVPIGLRDLWSDDPKRKDYNSLVQAPYAGSHEQLRRPDPLYDLILLTDWNWPVAKADAGSAIFIHQWRRAGFPTEGCVAFDRENLRWIAERVFVGTKIIVPRLIQRSR